MCITTALFHYHPFIKGMEEKYTKKEKLGSGTYGSVYKAVDNRTGEFVALKIMNISEPENGIPATTLREMSVLKSIHHPNVLSMKEVIRKPNSIILVMDYLDSDLFKLLYRSKSTRKLQDELVRSYCFQLLSGIFVLHSHRIIHRDLKPSNILLDQEGLLKIGDFGLSRYYSLPMRPYSPRVVTIWYKAPELCFSNDGTYNTSIDIWSAGCIMAEMKLKKPLFKGDSDIDQLHKIFEVLGPPNPDNFPDYDKLISYCGNIPKTEPVPLEEILGSDDLSFVDLISKMLIYDPSKRITAEKALLHPYFDNMPQKTKEVCLPSCLRSKFHK